jgi:hypothetical protein
MSDVRISQLPAADTPLSGAEIMPLVQGGVTVKATVNQIGGVFTSNTLQSVTDNGNVVDDGSGDTTSLYGGAIQLADNTNDNITNIGTGSISIYKVSEGGAGASLSNDTTLKGTVVINNGSNYGTVAATNITNNNIYQLPNASGTIALASDIVISTLQQVTASSRRGLTNNVNLQGTNAGTGTFSGTDINAFGQDSCFQNSGSNVNALGYYSGRYNTGSHVNGLGNYASAQQSGSNVNGFGYGAAQSNNGNNVNGMGQVAARANTGVNINALGYACGDANTGYNVNGLGYSAITSNIGSNVNALGFQAGSSNSASNVNALGYQAGMSNTFSNVTLLGSSAQANAAKQLVLADGTLNARISYANISANRTYELPDVGGTFPVMSGTPTPPNWTGFIPRWVGQSNIGASTLLSDNASTISIGNSSPSASARLQVDSTTSGFLPPRMTTANRNAISSPAEGLCVYDTTLHKLYVYDGTIWNACW